MRNGSPPSTSSDNKAASITAGSAMSQLQLPMIYLLPTRMEPGEVAALKNRIPTLTHNVDEAEVFLGKISRKERALFELRRLKLASEETPAIVQLDNDDDAQPAAKRQKLTGASEVSPLPASQAPAAVGASPEGVSEAGDGIVRVAKLSWLTESLAAGQVLPMDRYLIYTGRKHAKADKARPRSDEGQKEAPPSQAAAPVPAPTTTDSRVHPRTAASSTRRPPLLPESTSDHEMEMQLPPMPAYFDTKYSCQRPSPLNPPNAAFIEELKKVREIRTLQADDIGVRAYSTSIASLSAYPYKLTTAHEIARLPGCDTKIVGLYQDWTRTGFLQEVVQAEADAQLTVMKLFYNVWGVAASTARDWYNKGWRSLDDVVEFGWGSLSRVQQIGVKYYDELLRKIPRDEVESISQTILEHANARRPGSQLVITGGYRRGKQESGDVDVVVSHPDPAMTHDFIEQLVVSLEESGHITHTLTLSTRNSERGQDPVAWKGEGRKAGSGFDSLDKALVVWQDPRWDRSSAPKNPNVHRRVDIIMSPWKTVGCAVLGWTGATTFERDLRLYCKVEKGLKFDSSGIRDRQAGRWVDLESGPDGEPAEDMLTAERRVFTGLGLTWREPEERVTG